MRVRVPRTTATDPAGAGRRANSPGDFLLLTLSGVMYNQPC
jgi:hypothetical protein